MEPRKYNKMNFTTNRLMLPLFMLKREPLRQTQLEKIKEYIAKNRKQYSSTCQRENSYLYETATLKYLRHIAGLNDASQPAVLKRCPKHPSPYSRETYKIRDFHLPPNLYDSTKIPFKSRIGAKCVKWTAPLRKPKRKPDPVRTVKERTKKEKVENLLGSYDIHIEMPKVRKRCQLDINARALPPSSRGMCLNRPDLSSPGPAYYNIFENDCARHCNAVRKVNRKKHNYASTHSFLPKTTVPETETFLNKILKNISFRPGPGRYETRYRCACTSSHNRIFEPNLYAIVAHQKHLKFLGLPYTKIDQRRYYTPEYEHITGHGHTYLFKVKQSEDVSGQSKKKEEPPDGPYVQRILNPKRRPLYISTIVHKPKPPKVEFNCVLKVTKKRAAKTRKIGFSSTQPRFKGDEPPKIAPPLEPEQLEKIPPERRIRNYPITTTPISEIKGRLYEARPNREQRVIVRKKAFQFASIPGVKILVESEDFRPNLGPDEGYYFQNLQPEDYFLKTATESVIIYPSIYDLD